MKQCIENPNNLDWASYWAERLEDKVMKNWDEAAPGFYKRTHKEDYNTALFDKLILDKDDTVLDVGCGEGSVTVPLAKKVKKVIGIDSSPKMLEYLEKRAENNNINNIKTILKPIEEITYDEIGDVAVFLRLPLKRQGDQISKAAFRHGVLTGKQTVVGAEAQLMALRHSAGQQ